MYLSIPHSSRAKQPHSLRALHLGDCGLRVHNGWRRRVLSSALSSPRRTHAPMRRQHLTTTTCSLRNSSLSPQQSSARYIRTASDTCPRSCASLAETRVHHLERTHLDPLKGPAIGQQRLLAKCVGHQLPGAVNSCDAHPQPRVHVCGSRARFAALTSMKRPDMSGAFP